MLSGFLRQLTSPAICAKFSSRSCVVSRFFVFNASASLRCISSFYAPNPPLLSALDYEKLSEATLTSLADFFDGLPELVECDSAYDVFYSMGVLTVCISPDVGTYVLNKQAPNRQIWLSSPISGPKRYDFELNVLSDDIIDACVSKWIYRHDGVPLNLTLQAELLKIYGNDSIVVPK